MSAKTCFEFRLYGSDPGGGGGGGGGGGYSQKNWIGVCGALPKTFTLFMTKICYFSYPIYDLTLKSIPCFRPAL